MLLPAPDAGIGLSGLAHDRVVPSPSALSSTICARHSAFVRVSVLDHSAEPIQLGRDDGKGDAGSHARAATPPGSWISILVAIH